MTERQDGASFEATRVRAGGRSPALAIALVAALGGLLVIGAANGGDVSHAAPKAAVAVPTIRMDPTAAASIRPARTSRPTAVGGVRIGSAQTRVPGDVLVLDLRPAGSHLFVHGDVYSMAVARVSVALLDSDGDVATTETRRMPGGSRAFWTDPNPRFDVHFAVPDEMMGDGLSVQVSAFDAAGTRLARVHAAVSSPLAPF